MNTTQTQPAAVHNAPTGVHPMSAAGRPVSGMLATGGDPVSPRVPHELTVRLPDGLELFYRHWPARDPASRDCVVLFHRGHEHSGRLQHVVDELDLPDAHFIAWDARGHGKSPGDRGYAPSFGQIVRDADAFVHAVSARHDLPIDYMTVVAHSVGAIVAAAWVHDYNPPIRGMALVTPAVRVRLYVPLAIPSLRMMSKLKRRFNVKSYVRGKLLTHDPDAAAEYDADPLVSRNIAVNVLLGLHDTATRLLDDADAIAVPTLVLVAGSDWVVDNAATRRFFDRLSSPVKSLKTYSGRYHALLHEADRAEPIADLRGFMKRCQEPFLHPVDPADGRSFRAGLCESGIESGVRHPAFDASRNAGDIAIAASSGDRDPGLAESGSERPGVSRPRIICDAYPEPFSKKRFPAPFARLAPFSRPRIAARFDELSRPAPLWQRPWWAMQRVGLRLLAPLSRGIAIGFSDGFDSGRSLDHVYRDTPAGLGPIGRLIDRIYLNAPGWRGIRQRRRNMHAALSAALRDVLGRRWGAHIVDIAAGPGRYLLDVLSQPDFAAVSATLRDRDAAGLAAGQQLAADMQLADRVTYETGDAFDADQLASLNPRPDVAIVSGLYELFADNDRIARSLSGLAAAVPGGGYLIYTNQPWHPQLDMIARVLPNRDGAPWVMRCRSQHEIDALVASAGFTKLATHADDDGIFTVSLARREMKNAN